MSESTGAAPVAAPSAPAGQESGASADNANISTNVEASQEVSANQGQIDAINEAVENGELSEKQAQSMIRKLQLKVNGKIIEKEVDLSDEDFLRNQFQLAEAAKSSMQKAAEQEKLFRQLIEGGKKDPAAFIKEAFGLDPDEFAAMHIEKKIEHLKKSPEVLERERIQAELQAAREEAKRLKEEKEAIEMTKLQQETMSNLKNEISNAIKAHTKLPDTKYVQQKMAQALMWAEENGFQGATADDVAPLVEAEMRKEMNELYDLMPEELVEAMVGRKNIDRLRKSKIAKAKEIPSVNAIKPTVPVKEEKKSAEQQKIDAKRFWRGR